MSEIPEMSEGPANRISFVFFDAGGTLFDPFPSVGHIYSEAGRPYGLDAGGERLEEAFRRAWSRRMESASADPRGVAFGETPADSEAWWRALVDDVLESVGFTGDRDRCFEAFFRAFARPEAWRIYDDVVPVLCRLREDGVRLGVLSNWDHRLPGLLRDLGLMPYFETVVVSAFEGVGKPNPEIFRLACERVRLPRDRVAHVGDRPGLDLEPARSVGLRAYLIDRRGTAAAPDALRDLRELPERLDISGTKGR